MLNMQLQIFSVPSLFGIQTADCCYRIGYYRTALGYCYFRADYFRVMASVTKLSLAGGMFPAATYNSMLHNDSTNNSEMRLGEANACVYSPDILSIVNELTEAIGLLEATVRQHGRGMKGSESSQGSIKMDKQLPAPDNTKSKGKEAQLPLNIVRKEKTTIHVRIVFLKLEDIDTIHDRYTADVYMQTKWREPSLDGKVYLKDDEIDWSTYWMPKLYIENIIGQAKEFTALNVIFDKKGRAIVRERRRISGNFQEFMELYQFPFDTQDLTVTLTSDRSHKEVDFAEDALENCAVYKSTTVELQEWKVHSFLNTWKKTWTNDNKKPKTTHSAFCAACKASRRPEFFIWNIILVMCLICSLAFTTFSVDFTLPQNRLQLSFILLLTTVSFKFVVNQSLPMISYLTYLDKYILGCMTVLCCICVWHAAATLVNARFPTRVVWADKVALILLSSLYISLHLVFFFIASCLLSVVESDVKLNEKMREQGNSAITQDVLSFGVSKK